MDWLHEKIIQRSKNSGTISTFRWQFQGKAKRSIDFLERMETNTTRPQEIVPTIAEIDRDFLEIECGKDLLTSIDTEIGLSSMQTAGRHSIYEI